MKGSKKILVIRFSSIGDIVLTSPVLRCVRQQLNAEIHFLTKPQFSSLIVHNPHVSKVISWQDDLAKEIFGQLLTTQYDYIIDLHKNLRSFRIRKKLNIQAFDFDKANLEKWLMVRLKWNRLPGLHLVDRYFEGLKPLGVKNDGQGLDFFISNASKSLKEIGHEKLIEQGYYSLALGAAHFTKQIPESKLEEIINAIAKNIVLLGGPAEVELGQRLMKKFPGKVINLAGKTSIEASAIVIKDSEVLITPDTGMMHIGAALKKPIVSIWGNTIPEFGMYPYFPAEASKFTNVQVNNLSCRPCSKIGKKKCPKGHFKCMNNIEVNKILKAIQKLTS